MGRFLYQTVDVFVRSFSRQYSSAATGQLGQLRKKTGFALKNCKKALEKFDYNLEEAEKWLYEQAQAEGWAKACKLQSRPMSSGLLGLIKNNSGATMIEVNCETDFVAKNEKFKNLVYRLTAACHSHMTNDNSKTRFIPQADVSNISHEGKTLADLVALEIGIIGENMRLRRAVYIPATEEKNVDSYIHSSEENINVEGCKMGRFGSILQYSRTTPEPTVQESTGTGEDQDQLESSEEEPIEEITKDPFMQFSEPRTTWSTCAEEHETRNHVLVKRNSTITTSRQTFGHCIFMRTNLKTPMKCVNRHFCDHSSAHAVQELSHVDTTGKASMVDVGHKKISTRVAVACSTIHLGKEAFSLVEMNKTKKGDVLSVAQIAGIMAAKKTSELIPLCHNIELTKVDVKLTLRREDFSVYIQCEVKTSGKTGVEMEAITGATMAAVTVYDMCKAVNKGMVISDVKLLSKTGGKSGDYKHSEKNDM